MYILQSCALVLAVLAGCTRSTARLPVASPTPPAVQRVIAPTPELAVPQHLPPPGGTDALPEPSGDVGEGSAEPRAADTQKKTDAALSIEADARKRATTALTRLLRDRGDFSHRHDFRAEQAHNVEGVWHMEFGHYYRDIRVAGSSLTATFDADEHIRIEDDALYRHVRVDTRPRLSESKAFAVHRRRHPSDLQRGPIDGPMIIRMPIRSSGPVSLTRDHLAYVLHLTRGDGHGCRVHYSVWIDAHTGKELRSDPSLCIDCCRQSDPDDDLP